MRSTLLLSKIKKNILSTKKSRDIVDATVRSFLVGVIRDITESKLAEQTFKREVKFSIEGT